MKNPPIFFGLREKHHNSEGFVLVTALLLLMVLSLIGAAMSTTTFFEVTMAGNAKKSKEQFYKADAGINMVLAENAVPPSAFLPAAFATPFLNCNFPQAQLPWTTYDLNSDGRDDVSMYLLEKSTSGGPPEVEIASCAIENGTTSQIIAGIQYSNTGGSQTSPGDINEYQ